MLAAFRRHSPSDEAARGRWMQRLSGCRRRYTPVALPPAAALAAAAMPPPTPSPLPHALHCSAGTLALPTLSCLKSQAATLQDQYSELHARFQETLAAEVRWLGPACRGKEARRLGVHSHGGGVFAPSGRVRQALRSRCTPPPGRALAMRPTPSPPSLATPHANLKPQVGGSPAAAQWERQWAHQVRAVSEHQAVLRRKGAARDTAEALRRAQQAHRELASLLTHI